MKCQNVSDIFMAMVMAFQIFMAMAVVMAARFLAEGSPQ